MIFLWTILFRGESCLPYNVGSEEEIDIRSLAKLVSSAFGIKKDIVISKKPDIKAQIERYIPSTQRAREKLNLGQTVGLKDAIEKTIKYIKFKEGSI